MHNKQKGQILPLGLAMLVLAMLGAFAVYNTGRFATDKMRLANVADAAAYSGALWQARALNFQAYSNRAMVANQVAIGQIVSLRSWAAYGAITSENIANVLKGIPVLNGLAAGLEAGLAAFEAVVKSVATVLVPTIDAVNRALSVSQNIMYFGTFQAIPDVVNAVVDHSDSRFSADSAYSAIGMAKTHKQWIDFTERYDRFDSAAMRERERMINRSRDAFSRDRDWDLSTLLFPPNLFYSQKVIRQGQTRLVRYNTSNGPEWEWKAKDTVSLHTKINYIFGSKKKEIPIGWSQAFANSRSQLRTLEGPGCGLGGVQRCQRYTENNKKSERYSDIGIPSPVKRLPTNIPIRGYGGIHGYNSLSQSALRNEDPRLQLKIEVSMPVKHAYKNTLDQNKGLLHTPKGASAELSSSISVAEVYFQPPDIYGSVNGRSQKANGYNPYWLARLADVPLSDRVLAFSLRRD
ncbi:MAG: Tad domain-containing protein [Granulosicoccus sp.]|nr:Tad domain-containing protein [Granulosicoccus sp.]